MSAAHREAFNILGYPVYWYGIIIATGVLLALFIAIAREKRIGVKPDTTINIALIAIPVGLIFARLYYVVFSLDQYLQNPASIFNIREGGLALWGGVIGGAAATYLYARFKKISFLQLADLLCPALVFAQGVGRWGNFMNQEAYGIAITNPSLQFFPIAVFIEAQGTWFAATFFYESFWCMLTCGLLIWLERSGRQRARGDLFIWYLVLYGFERSIVEGLRLDSLMLNHLRVSQLLSLLLVIIGAATFFARMIRSGAARADKAFLALALALSLAAPVLIALGLLGEFMVVPAAILALLAAIRIYHLLHSKRNEVFS